MSWEGIEFVKLVDVRRNDGKNTSDEVQASRDTDEEMAGRRIGMILAEVSDGRGNAWKYKRFLKTFNQICSTSLTFCEVKFALSIYSRFHPLSKNFTQREEYRLFSLTLLPFPFSFPLLKTIEEKRLVELGHRSGLCLFERGEWIGKRVETW